MIDFLIHHIALKPRIYAGYLILGSSALLIALLANLALKSLESEVSDYASFADFSVDMVAFRARMSEMQRQVLIYIHDGHKAAADRADDIYEDMATYLKPSKESEATQIKPLLAEMQSHLDNYIKTFKEVKKQRDITEELVRFRLREHANRAQNLLENIAFETADNRTPSSVLTNKLLNSFLQIEKNAYRYFDSLESQYANLASQNISTTKRRLDTLTNSLDIRADWIESLTVELGEYERDLNEAVQRTRGYLFLINVVMAAEAYEINYHAEKLSALIMKEAESTRSEVKREIGTTINTLLYISTAILMSIACMAFLISKSITQPLRKLTKSFNSITNGDLTTDVPAYPQQDELGDLAQAADFLKGKSLELNEYKKELERSNDELEQFVYTVSHDLKSPIVTSMGFIGIIQKLAKQGEYEKAVSKLDRVVKSNTRMSQLVNDLLELSRVGRTDLERQQIDLNNFVPQFIDGQNEQLRRAGVSVHIMKSLPVIDANESRVLQVFENLLSNALKYGKHDKKPLISIGSKVVDGKTLVYFSDNGPGIAEEYQKKIFGLFYRLDSNVEGSGIGLAVAKKVMINHNGDIWVTSTPGEGATFWLEFPPVNTMTFNQ